MITLAEIKNQLIELYLADGYTFDEAHEMIEEGEITWKGKRGCIQHVNGKIDSFKISEVISWVEENVYTDPFIKATEWMTEEQVCAPEIKANNHKVDLMPDCRFGFSESIKKHYTQEHYMHNVFGGDLIDISADQTPESWMHQPFIDYTNENTNRA